MGFYSDTVVKNEKQSFFVYKLIITDKLMTDNVYIKGVSEANLVCFMHAFFLLWGFVYILKYILFVVYL